MYLYIFNHFLLVIVNRFDDEYLPYSSFQNDLFSEMIDPEFELNGKLMKKLQSNQKVPFFSYPTSLKVKLTEFFNEKGKEDAIRDLIQHNFFALFDSSQIFCILKIRRNFLLVDSLNQV